MNETMVMNHGATGAQASLLADESFEPASAAPNSNSNFRTFYNRHHDFVWRNLQRLGVSPDMVEDAVQEVMVRLHDDSVDQRSPEEERKWVFAMVRRIAALFRRTQQRRARRHDAWDQASRYTPARTAAGESQKLEASVAISRLLDELTSRDREVITLVDLEGVSGPELATIQGTSLNTAYARIRVARRHVRELVHNEQQPQRLRALHPACAALLMLPGADPETRAGLSAAFTASTADRTRGWQNFVEDVGPGALTSAAATSSAATTSALAYKLYAGVLGLAAGIAVGVGGTTLYHQANPHVVHIQPEPPVVQMPVAAPTEPIESVPDDTQSAPTEQQADPAPPAPPIPQARSGHSRTRRRKPADDGARRLKLEVQAIEAALKAMDAGDFDGALRFLDKAQYQVGVGLMKAERRDLRAKIHCYKARGAHNTACEH